MDKKTEFSLPKIRFNILDAVILLLIILCIVGLCFRHTITESLGLGDDLQSYRVSFEVRGERYTLPGQLAKGDKLYFADGILAGTLMGVDEYSIENALTAGNETLIVTPAETYVNDGGSFVSVSYPEGSLIDAEGAFRCEGGYGDGGYFLLSGDRYLAVGQTLTLYTDTVKITFTVTEIELLS